MQQLTFGVLKENVAKMHNLIEIYGIADKAMGKMQENYGYTSNAAKLQHTSVNQLEST